MPYICRFVTVFFWFIIDELITNSRKNLKNQGNYLLKMNIICTRNICTVFFFNNDVTTSKKMDKISSAKFLGPDNWGRFSHFAITFRFLPSEIRRVRDSLEEMHSQTSRVDNLFSLPLPLFHSLALLSHRSSECETSMVRERGNYVRVSRISLKWYYIS